MHPSSFLAQIEIYRLPTKLVGEGHASRGYSCVKCKMGTCTTFAWCTDALGHAQSWVRDSLEERSTANVLVVVVTQSVGVDQKGVGVHVLGVGPNAGGRYDYDVVLLVNIDHFCTARRRAWTRGFTTGAVRAPKCLVGKGKGRQKRTARTASIQEQGGPEGGSLIF